MNTGGRAFKAFAVILAVLLTAAACAPAAAPAPAVPAAPAAPAPSSAAPSPRTAPTVALPKRGSSITLPIPQILKGTDPHTTQVLAKEVWLQAGNALIDTDAQNFTLQPGLAESWSVSPDGKTITLNIRKGVKWQNVPPISGREFTADDAVYNLRRIAGRFPVQGKTFWRTSMLLAMDDAAAADKYTVKITMKQPSVSFLASLASVWNPMVPRELVDQCGGVLDDTLKCTVGTGPLVLKTFEDGVQATWDRNPGYWKKGADEKPLPYLDQVKWVWFGDVATIVSSIAVGKAAMYQKATLAEVSSLKATQAKVRLTYYDKTVVWTAHLNHSKPPFNDLRVRTAIDLVLERRKSLNNAQGDIPWNWTGFLPRTYGDLVVPEEEIKNRPGFRDDKTEDVKTARKLLEEAGYGPNKLLMFKVYASATSDCGRDCPILFADQINTHLKGLAHVTPAPVPSTERAKRESDGDFDFFFHPLAADPDPGTLLTDRYHSKGSRNVSKYNSPQMDRLLEEQERTFDREKRKQLLWQIQRLGLDDRVLIGWGGTWTIMVMQPNLKGWIPGADIAGGDIFYSVDKVWLDEMPSPATWPIIDR